jgi:hypothetical protein
MSVTISGFPFNTTEPTRDGRIVGGTPTTIVNISGFPFNTTEPTQDGRIVGGTPTTIVDHPYQVELLTYC